MENPADGRELGRNLLAQENGRGLRRLFAPRKVLWYVRRRILFFVGACRVDCGASSGACRPMGRSHFSFGGERKVCKRKPAARRLREKALYCPFLKEGVRNVARSMVKLTTFTFVRARAHSFPLSKRARLFPSAAYRRSAPPQLAAGRRTPCGLGCFVVARLLCRTKMKTFVSHTVGDERASPLWGNGLLLLGRFRKVSGQRVWGREP